MIIYHVTTPKKAKKYKQSGMIHRPVRGFNTLLGATIWAMKVGRQVIYEVQAEKGKTYKLPDHHNEYGNAYWIDDDINLEKIKCVVSAN